MPLPGIVLVADAVVGLVASVVRDFFGAAHHQAKHVSKEPIHSLWLLCEDAVCVVNLCVCVRMRNKINEKNCHGTELFQFIEK